MRISAKTWLPLLGAGLAALWLAGPARAADADKLIPADAVLAGSINVHQIVESPLFQKYGKDEAEKGLKDEKAKKLLDAIGLDPLKDIDHVLFTSTGDVGQPKVLVVAHGNFNADKIRAAAEKAAQDKPDELKITKEGDLTIYEGKGDNKQTVYAHVAADGKRLLASTDKDYLLQAIKSPSSGPSQELQNALGKIPAKQSMWVAMAVTPEMKKQVAAANPQAKAMANKLEAVTGAVNIGDDVQTNVVIYTVDSTSAGDVKKMLNQFKSLAALMAQTNEDAAPILQDLLDSLKITTDQSSVKVSLKVTEEQIEKAAAKDKKDAPEKPAKPENKEK